jgi:hypothetical protein
MAKVLWTLPCWRESRFLPQLTGRKKTYLDVPRMCLLDEGAYPSDESVEM